MSRLPPSIPSRGGRPVPAGRRPLRPTDPANPGRTDTTSAGKVLVVMVAALAAAAVLNAQALLDDARGQPLGTGRTVSIAVWSPVARVAAFVGLDRPRNVAEQALGRADEGPTVTVTIPPLDQPDPTPAPAGTGTADAEAGTVGDGDAEAEADQAAGSDPTEPTGPPPLPPATAEDELQVLLVGDSTMTQLAGALTRKLVDTGVAEVQTDARPATGFSRPDFFDWPSRLAELVGQDSTDLTIAMFGANDAQGFEHDGEVHDFGSESWVRIYRARVTTAMQQLVSRGDPVIWIGQPAMRSASFDTKVQLIDRIVREEAARYPAIRYVDARTAMGGADGAFAEHRTGNDGQRTRIRDGDGIHFTTPGADLLAEVVLEPVLAELAAGSSG